MSLAKDNKRYALRFLSGKYQGGEFPLRNGSEIVIGRADDLESGMILEEDMVSRQHARVIRAGSNIVIQDLGSTNGTFVNGERVTAARLDAGDRILIGTNILKLVQKDLGDGAGACEEADAASGRRPPSSGASMAGRIDDVPVADLLQLLAATRRGGVLVVSAERIGKVYLREGCVYYAVIDDDQRLGPAKALNRMLGWDSGVFELEPESDERFEAELTEPTEALLMEALRQLDELRRIEPELPDAAASISLAGRLDSPLRDLSADELDVLQLAHNGETIEDVFDGSALSDLETGCHLLSLIRRGFLTAA